jgi:hypothetical protein
MATALEEGRLFLMKTIGLIGGMSWESTVSYYRLINTAVKEKLGGLHSAKCVLCSVDFAEVEESQRRGQWPEAAQLLVGAAQRVEKAGADFVLICTNTMHKLADAVQAGIGIPLLHIADATAEKVKQAGVQRVGLLGTRFTMEEDFYQQFSFWVRPGVKGGRGAGLTARWDEAARRLFHFVRDSQLPFEYPGPGCRPNPSSRAAA